MKSANEIGPSRRMRSRKRSARSCGTRLALYFRSENFSVRRLRRCRPLPSPRGPLRVATSSASDDRRLFGPRLAVGRELSRGLEDGREGPGALRARLPVERTPPRRRARGSALEAPSRDPRLPGAADALARRERESSGRSPRPARGDPVTLRDARADGKRPLRVSPPRKEARSDPRSPSLGKGSVGIPAPGGGQGPRDPLARTGRLVADGVRLAPRVDFRIRLETALRRRHGGGRADARSSRLPPERSEE